MRVRKAIDKDGVKAAVAVNVDEPGSVTAASSTQRAADDEAEEVKEEDGRELPDREGTYDELREEATKEATEGEQDG
jgi:division protein CdvB (Snf7/Vps24/ESCRT-III family)